MTLNNKSKRLSCNSIKSEKKAQNQYNKDRCISYLPLSNDVWDAASLGLKIDKSQSNTKLIFIYIKPQDFKEVAKKFIRYQASRYQLTTLARYIHSFNKFSDFLLEFYPDLNFNQINRKIIINYINWLSSLNLKSETRDKHLYALKKLFLISSINQWIKIPDNLIRQEDFGKINRPLPRYLPEEVIEQINKYINNLPEPIERMILILQECGLRIGELCLLPINCLKQDSKGDWYIQFMQWKMKQETTLPISHGLAKVIQEQQKYIQHYFQRDFNYLFCGGIYHYKKNIFLPQQKVIKSGTFTKYLKLFAERYNIRDNTGKKWNFQTHQFRHTVGTKMINNGVPHHIVQRYLGHTSPKMTMTYAYIHDKTLKKEIAKYHDSTVVNIAGEVIESQTPELDNDLDLHLLRKKILAQSLPNGSCARPIQLGECPHANACLTCGDFRTTMEFLEQHKTQLKETKQIIKKAEEKGWERQVEMNKRLENNLEKIINTLESKDKEIILRLEE